MLGPRTHGRTQREIEAPQASNGVANGEGGVSSFSDDYGIFRGCRLISPNPNNNDLPNLFLPNLISPNSVEKRLGEMLHNPSERVVSFSSEIRGPG